MRGDKKCVFSLLGDSGPFISLTTHKTIDMQRLRGRLRALIIAHHAMAAAHIRRGAAPMRAGS